MLLVRTREKRYNNLVVVPLRGCAGWVYHLVAGLICYLIPACHDVFLRGNPVSAIETLGPDNVKSYKKLPDLNSPVIAGHENGPEICQHCAHQFPETNQ